MSTEINERKEAILAKKEKREAILAKIESFKHLKDNWNGYGARPFNIEFLDKCIKFISKFKDDYIEELEVFPVSDNIIQLEWDNKITGEYLEIELNPTPDEKCGCLYGVQKEDCREEYREFRVQNSNAGIKRVIEKFKNGEYLKEES